MKGTVEGIAQQMNGASDQYLEILVRQLDNFTLEDLQRHIRIEIKRRDIAPS